MYAELLVRHATPSLKSIIVYPIDQPFFRKIKCNSFSFTETHSRSLSPPTMTIPMNTNPKSVLVFSQLFSTLSKILSWVRPYLYSTSRNTITRSGYFRPVPSKFCNKNGCGCHVYCLKIRRFIVLSIGKYMTLICLLDHFYIS